MHSYHFQEKFKGSLCQSLPAYSFYKIIISTQAKVWQGALKWVQPCEEQTTLNILIPPSSSHLFLALVRKNTWYKLPKTRTPPAFIKNLKHQVRCLYLSASLSVLALCVCFYVASQRIRIIEAFDANHRRYWRKNFLISHFPRRGGSHRALNLLLAYFGAVETAWMDESKEFW